MPRSLARSALMRADDRLVAVIAILAERHLAQEEIAELVHAIGIGERERVDHVADRLRHLLTAIEQESVRENPPRHVDAGRHQKRRPIDRVKAHDVLADHMKIGGPQALEPRLVIGKADGGDVIGERIHPDIHHMLGIARHRHAPVEGGARDRQVLKAGAHEARHLVQPLARQNEIRNLVVEVEQLILVGGEAEEIALLLHPFDRRSGLGREPRAVLVQMGLVFGVIGLIADRVPAGIFVEIDVTGCLHPPPDRLRGPIMARLGGADEIVVGAVQPLDHGAETRHVAIQQVLRRQTIPRRRLLDLLAVLVGAGEKEHVIAVEALKARDGIGRDHLIGVADMRRAVRIGNRGGDGVAGLFGHGRVVGL